MNERQWELYRLSVVESWPDSPYKTATIAAIQHKLAMIGDLEASSKRDYDEYVATLPNTGHPH